MAPRKDPWEIENNAPWDHTTQRQITAQLEGTFRALAALSDRITSLAGEVTACRRAIESSSAAQENARLGGKRRQEIRKGNGHDHQ